MKKHYVQFPKISFLAIAIRRSEILVWQAIVHLSNESKILVRQALVDPSNIDVAAAIPAILVPTDPVITKFYARFSIKHSSYCFWIK